MAGALNVKCLGNSRFPTVSHTAKKTAEVFLEEEIAVKFPSYARARQRERERGRREKRGVSRTMPGGIILW